MTQNFEEIYERIQKAKSKAGRTDKIFFTAVSKTRAVEEMKEAEKISWVDFFGENRVQEAESKRASYPDSKIKWRLIGHLQNNKARKAVEIFDSIDSVDSIELALRLNRIAEEINKKIPILIEVNTSGEESKSGVKPENFSQLLDVAIAQENLKLDGLMTVGPLTDDEKKIRNSFATLRGMIENARATTRLPLPILSMGMSDDFELAILEGSTMVRIGTLLFGKRFYQNKN
ncbi:MAG: YggS family pyridoxal phosphate-dependent enzyme [Synergistaceae bacterium]|nr:YggS family pyridoxal phosphate-dependent enzyme [Synergistaceae bacterium]